MFVAQGYHAAAMDDIAERAGVSKPVLYQHFPGKLDLYLALLDQSCDTIIASCRARAGVHRTTTSSASPRPWHAFYDYVASAEGAFRLVFESDLTNEPAVRERVDRVTTECAAMIADVIHDDTGLPGRAVPAARGLPGGNGPGQRAVLAGRRRRATIDASEDAAALVAGLAWRGIRGYPRTDEHLTRPPGTPTTHDTTGGPPMEVKIGVQHAARELVLDADTRRRGRREAGRRGARQDGGVLALTDAKGRRVVVPGDKLAYVEIGDRAHRDGRLPQLAGEWSGENGRWACVIPEGAGVMGTLGTILVVLIGGTIIGLLGKLVAPGDRDNIPLWLTIVCGIGGMLHRQLPLRRALRQREHPGHRLVASRLAGRRRGGPGDARGLGERADAPRKV